MFRIQVLTGSADIYPEGQSEASITAKSPYDNEFSLNPAPKDGRIGSADKVAVAVGSASERPSHVELSAVEFELPPVVRVIAIDEPIKVRHYYYQTNFTETELEEGKGYAAVVNETNKVTLAVYPTSGDE